MKLPLTLLAAVTLAATVAAQGGANLAGTWTIDRAATPGGGAGRGAGAIAGIPIATTITITIAPEDKISPGDKTSPLDKTSPGDKISPGDVIVESDTGSGQTMQTAVYKVDGSSNPVPGPLGWETTAKAMWDSGKLVVTTRRSMTGPTGPMGVDVKDVFSVAGNVLTIERSMGRATQKLVYTKGESK